MAGSLLLRPEADETGFADSAGIRVAWRRYGNGLTADRTLDVDSVKAVTSSMPGADLVLLDGLGHRPDISRPAIINPILSDFLGPAPSAVSAPGS